MPSAAAMINYPNSEPHSLSRCLVPYETWTSDRRNALNLPRFRLFIERA